MEIAMSLKTQIPTFEKMMNPLIKALKELGGSATIEELDTRVAEIMGLSDEQIEILHESERGGSKSEAGYRLAWTRTYLKQFGIVENSTRGIWALTPKGRKTESVDPKEVKKFFRESKKKDKQKTEFNGYSEETDLYWTEELRQVLRKLPPDAFERLIQRVLRESGFIQVQVTGRTGDGGIDGKGIMRLAGLLSFHVIFQAKRWKGSVGAGVIRDFRGAMVGRADKGILITTGTFTKDAIKEATRDGASPIDLVDGEQLVEKLKQLSLGVETKKVEVEQVIIDHNWFSNV
jgi:restriction system protein